MAPMTSEEDLMRLSVKGMAVACGVLWGTCILLVGVANLIVPGYGRAVLDLAASIYPGYDPGGGGFVEVIIGGLYSLVDGAAGGAIFAWLYNKAASHQS